MVPGAAGGPKWLILKALDDFLFGDWFLRGTKPIDFVGASIGAWRFAAGAAGRTDLLGQLYKEQRYSERPDVQEITRGARAIVAALLADGAAEAIIGHPRFRLAILAVRSRGLLASEQRLLQGPGLLGVGLLNALSSRAAGLGFARHAVHHPDFETSLLDRTGWSAERSVLDGPALGPALLASGSIPLVLEGVGIPGAPPGVYRDGGITDYHIPLPFRDARDGIVFYPHFSSTFKPGWFDKALPWRRLDPLDLDRTFAVVPSAELVASLPGGKIPDRKDFAKLDYASRQRAWQAAVEASRSIADAFVGWLDRGTPVEDIEPFPEH
ncbi:MAG: hypothetical protein AAGE01_17890 [Pseudomonadota bacterium]